MNYAWARDFTLELIDQYSVAGKKVLPSYDNQADYLHKIPRLLDDAATLAATTSHKLREIAPLSCLEHKAYGTWAVYTLPKDCWQMCGGLIRLTGAGCERDHSFRLLGSDAFAVPAALDGDLSVEYFRKPRLLGESPAEDAELDNTQAVQQAQPYYAAAHLVMLDNAFAYAALLNEFERKLAVPGELPQAEFHAVQDVYGGDGTCR